MISSNLLTHVGITTAYTPAAAPDYPPIHICWVPIIGCWPWPVHGQPVHELVLNLFRGEVHLHRTAHQFITSHIESSWASVRMGTHHSIASPSLLLYLCNLSWPNLNQRERPEVYSRRFYAYAKETQRHRPLASRRTFVRYPGTKWRPPKAWHRLFCRTQGLWTLLTRTLNFKSISGRALNGIKWRTSGRAMIGYGSVQILHDETVATGIRNGAKMVVEGGVSLHLHFSCFNGVKMVQSVRAK